jgi:hypothetical protein
MSSNGKSASGDGNMSTLTPVQRDQITEQNSAFTNTITPQSAMSNYTSGPFSPPSAGYSLGPTPGAVTPTPQTAPQQSFNPTPGAAPSQSFDYGPMVSQMQQYVQSMQKLFDSYNNRG